MADRADEEQPPPTPGDPDPFTPLPVEPDARTSGVGAPPTSAPAPRQGRFAIPDPEGHRLEEKIEAFLEGPDSRRTGRTHRGAAAAPTPPLRPIRPERLDHPLKLDSRADWNAAFGMEAARHERYGRPVAVTVIEADVQDQAGREPSRIAVDAMATALGQLLRASMRETDRIARMSPTRFNLLLPETSRAEARRFAERARRAGEAGLASGGLRVRLRVTIAAPGRDESLADALAAAEAELAG